MSRVLKISLGMVLLGQAVMAQPVTVPPPVTTTPTQSPADVDISVRQRSKLSPSDMLAKGRDYRTKMEQVVKQVQALVEQARKQKDIIRLNCLSDKLAQLKANLSVADNALQTLQEAIVRRDEGASVHEYTRITIVNQKAQVISSESQACVGEDLSYVGTTRVDVETSGIPDEDPTNPPAPEPLDSPYRPLDRPPQATPTA